MYFVFAPLRCEQLRGAVFSYHYVANNFAVRSYFVVLKYFVVHWCFARGMRACYVLCVITFVFRYFVHFLGQTRVVACASREIPHKEAPVNIRGFGIKMPMRILGMRLTCIAYFLSCKLALPFWTCQLWYATVSRNLLKSADL